VTRAGLDRAARTAGWPAALGALLLALTAARLPAAWESGNALNHVSGAWMALADDLAHGTFYRALQDPALGFGGTRFFPLEFSLHAALLSAGAPLLPSGFALSAAAGLALVGFAYALLRRAGLPAAAALTGAALALAGFAGQHALSAIRGDLLAVALQVAALAALAPGATRRRLALAALALTLAFATKPTALTALAAAVAWLLLRGERRAAVGLGVVVGLAAAAVTAATDALSDGRFGALLSACASGGAGPGDALRAPLRLARELYQSDPAGLVLVSAGAVALARAGGGGWLVLARGPAGLAALWVTAAWGGALVVFALPGTGVNHLLEVEAASAVLLGATAAAAPGLRARVPALAAAAAGLVLAAGLWRADARGGRLAELRAVAAALPPGAPVLSEDPLVPLLAGRRPLAVDTWMLRLAAERDPAADRPLRAALSAGRIPVVVLLADVDGPEADAWFTHGDLGLGPVEEIRRGFRLDARAGRYRLYRHGPAPQQAPPKTPDVVMAGPAEAVPVPAAPPAQPAPPPRL
jgi:hypothetical protein